jgi:hypothetical protein
MSTEYVTGHRFYQFSSETNLELYHPFDQNLFNVRTTCTMEVHPLLVTFSVLFNQYISFIGGNVPTTCAALCIFSGETTDLSDVKILSRQKSAARHSRRHHEGLTTQPNHKQASFQSTCQRYLRPVDNIKPTTTTSTKTSRQQQQQSCGRQVRASSER